LEKGEGLRLPGEEDDVLVKVISDDDISENAERG